MDKIGITTDVYFYKIFQNMYKNTTDSCYKNNNY